MKRVYHGNEGALSGQQASTSAAYGNAQQNTDIPPNFIGGTGSDDFAGAVKGDLSGAPRGYPANRRVHESGANTGNDSATLSNTERRQRREREASMEWQALSSKDQRFYGEQQPLKSSYEQAAFSAMTEMAQQKLGNQDIKTRSGNASPARLAQITETKAPTRQLEQERESLQHHSYRNHQLPASNSNSAERAYKVPAGVKGNPSPTDGETTSQYTMLKGVTGHKYQHNRPQ